MQYPSKYLIVGNKGRETEKEREREREKDGYPTRV